MKVLGLICLSFGLLQYTIFFLTYILNDVHYVSYRNQIIGYIDSKDLSIFIILDVTVLFIGIVLFLVDLYQKRKKDK